MRTEWGGVPGFRPIHQKAGIKLILCRLSATAIFRELCWNLGDEADQAALCGFSSMTSIPSWNLAPAMSLGN
jgi:hypothetical protein